MPPPLFAFGFDNPAVLGWAAAAAAPIVIHLLSRRRYREVSWAAMEYLLSAVRRHTRRMLLEQWLLLAVRTLIVVLVVLAAAKPYFEKTALIFAPGENTHRVLVFDGSFSMAYQPGEQSRFERAKGLARQIVENSAQGDAFTLLWMSSPPRVIVGKPALERSEILREIDQLALPQSVGNLPATMDLLEKHLLQARRENARLTRQQVFFLTDLQRISWAPALGGAGWAEFRRRTAAVAEQAALVVLDVGQPAAPNLAVTALDVSDLPAIQGREMTIRAVLRNFGGQAKSSQAVELLIDGRKVEQKTVDLPPETEKEAGFTYRFMESGDHAVEIHAPGDALAADNRRWRIVPVRAALGVLCIDGRPSGGRFQGAADYVAAALAPQSQAGAVKVETAPESALSERTLTRYDCVFLCNVAQFTDHEARLLDAYLQSGGNVVIWLGSQSEAERYNRVLGVVESRESRGESGESRGENLQRPAILPARIGKRAERRLYRIDPRGYRHPIAAGFRGRGEKALLSTPLFDYFKLDVPKESSAGAGQECLSSRVVFSTLEGDPLVVERRVHRGRVVLLGAPIDGPGTPLPRWPSFLPLVQEILAYCATGQSEQRNVTVGRPLSGMPPEAAAGMEVELQTPQGRTIELTAGGSPASWRFDDTWQSGIYEVRAGGDAAGRQLYAVNVDPSESNLAAISPDTLHGEVWPGIALTVQTTWRNLDRPGAMPLLTPAPGLQVELLYAVAILLFFETLLAWRFGHAPR